MDLDPTTRRLSEREAAAEAKRIIDAAYQPTGETGFATSYRDDSPPHGTGALPVPQPDNRVVPAWAAGVAVASIGVGAGVTGLGCGAWLILQGLSSVTLYGVLAVTLPFAGLAAVVTAIGTALSRARAPRQTNIYQGTVTQNTRISNTSQQRGMFARTHNDVH
ncbi:hypothetical protein [Streptomyces tsukubensis]|uniref:hypothetical protein n=1 Tax=Streptomyces tsukubensis TaxID=83656 RepID=UPI00344FD66C